MGSAEISIDQINLKGVTSPNQHVSCAMLTTEFSNAEKNKRRREKKHGPQKRRRANAAHAGVELQNAQHSAVDEAFFVGSVLFRARPAGQL